MLRHIIESIPMLKISSLKKLVTDSMAVDLGTANTIIAVKGRGVVLDEPFGALDMFTREELWLALQELWMARRPTVILVTHDLREAVFLADRVLVMSARPGRIILDRTVKAPRPRNLNTTYEPDAVKLVHELREHISAARANAA